MVWYFIAGTAFLAAIVLLLYTYIRDRKYLRKKTSQAMSGRLWGEIEQERQQSLKRRERFQKELEEARKR